MKRYVLILLFLLLFVTGCKPASSNKDTSSEIFVIDQVQESLVIYVEEHPDYPEHGSETRKYAFHTDDKWDKVVVTFSDYYIKVERTGADTTECFYFSRNCAFIMNAND